MAHGRNAGAPHRVNFAIEESRMVVYFLVVLSSCRLVVLSSCRLDGLARRSGRRCEGFTTLVSGHIVHGLLCHSDSIGPVLCSIGLIITSNLRG